MTERLRPVTGTVHGRLTVAVPTWARVLLVATLVGVWAGGITAVDRPSTSVGAAAPRTVVVIDGEPGASLIDNDIAVMTAADAEVTVGLLWPSEMVVRGDVSDTDPRKDWLIRINTPTSRPVAVGHFESAAAAGVPGDRTRLALSGGNYTCASQSGTFTIHEFVTSGEVVTNLALSFEFHCEAGFESIFGEVRFASSVPLAAIDIDTRSVGFDVVDVGTAAPDRTITVTNVGDGPQHLVVGITGLDPDSFELVSDGCTGADLQPGASCAIDVRFTPVRAGSAQAVVEIESEAPARFHAIELIGSTP